MENLDKALFFDSIRTSLFKTLSIKQVQGIEAILSEWQHRKPDGDLRWLAYMLATAYHETAYTMQPIKEYGGNAYYTKLYDVTGSNPTRARQMGNTSPGDGAKYCGRGFVQLTWKVNYERAGNALGLDLVNNPDAALEQNIAAAIMFLGMENGWFTGKKLSDYFNANSTDWLNARRIINGTDKASTIAQYAQSFYKALVDSSIQKVEIEPNDAKTIANLRLRESPITGNIITVIPLGTLVKIEDDWSKVTVDIDGISYSGWVASRFLARTEDGN